MLVGGPLVERRRIYDLTDRRFRAKGGGNDDSAAFLRARDAVVATGGCLHIPAGQWVLKEPVLFPPFGTSRGERAVHLTGDGYDCSQVVWTPPNDTEFTAFQWGDGTSAYWGGGLRNLMVRAGRSNVAGRVLAVDYAVRWAASNVIVRECNLATGMWLGGAAPTPTQNTHLSNVWLEQCLVGAHLANVGELTASGCKLNQCGSRALVVGTGSSITWSGGMIQGGGGDCEVELAAAAQVGPITFGGSIHIETQAPTVFRIGSDSNPDGWGRRVRISGCAWQGANPDRTFVEAYGLTRGLVIEDVDCGGKVLYARGRVCGRVVDAVVDASRYDLGSTCQIQLYPDPQQEDWGDPTAPPPIQGARWVLVSP